MNAKVIEFLPNALYRLETVAEILGCTPETVQRRLKCEIRIAGCIAGHDALKALHGIAEALSDDIAAPVEPRRPGRPVKNKPVIDIARTN